MKIFKVITPLIISANTAIIPFSAYSQNDSQATFFTGQPPVFVGVKTPDSTVDLPDAHYYFTFTLPSNSIEAIAQITIQQQESPNFLVRVTEIK